jgi:EmrB/QacA subfamily drug resistance transporter
MKIAPRPAPAPLAPTGLRDRTVARLEARGTYSRWVLFAALAGTFATSFPITILTISLGAIADEFGVRATTIAWVLSAPLLLSAITLPLLGKLGDLYGHRLVFLTGSALAVATAVATAWAWDATSLICLRTIAAVVGGATQPTSIALIVGVYPPHERVHAMGWWSMTGALAPAFGLVAGGPLVDLFGWRVVFLMQAGVATVALLLAALVLRETKPQRVRLDIAGVITLGIGVGGLMLALGRVRDVGVADPSIWAAVAVGLIALAAFTRVERRAVAPLLPLEFFRLRNFSAAIVSNACNGGAYMGAFAIAPLLLLNVFGYSVTMTSGVMLIRTLTLTVSSPFGGRLGARIGERAAAVFGAGVMALSLVLIAAASLQVSLALLVCGLILQGLGHGLSIPSLAAATTGAVPAEHLGIAAATNRLSSQIGVAFGITTLMMVYGGHNEPAAFRNAFLVGAALAAAATLTAAGMQPWKRR